jgi:cation:H+ antiporter
MMHIFWLLLGLAMLTVGAEALVRGSLAAAKRLGVSALLAGLVIVGFGTSSPELVVSLKAALDNQPEIALGNIIGSNIANILLILGLSALITPLITHPKCLRRDALVMVLATLLFMLLASLDGLSLLDGIVFIIGLAAYLYWAYTSDKRDTASAQLHAAEAEEMTVMPMGWPLTLLAIVGGLALLVAGADRFLLGAVGLGKALGVPEAIIGLTLVAVGTSLPELAVSVLAAIKGHADVAVGNIVGSNIFNILCILGVSALLQPLPLTGRMFTLDQWVMLAAALLLVAFLARGLRLGRWQGGVMLLCYTGYVLSMFGGAL